MPRIVEYTSPIDKLVPSDEGARSLASAGRNLGYLARVQGQMGREVGSAFAGAARSVGQAVDTYEEHKAQQEISAGATGLVNMHDDINQEWQQTAKTADPNDPNVAQKFRAGLEDRYQKFIDSFHTEAGQRWATMQVASLKQHVFEKTAADQATMAGDALVQNLDVLKNRASSMVHDDPTSLDQTLGLIDNSVTALVEHSPNLTAAQAQKARTDLAQHIKSEVAKSAVEGMAEKNPDEAIKFVQSGKLSDYITGDDARHLTSYAQAQSRMKRIDADLAQTAAKRAQEQASQAQTQSYLDSFVDKTTGKVAIPPGSAADILKDKKLLPAAKVELIGFANRMNNQQREETTHVVTDPAVRQDLISRMSLQPGQPGAYSALDLYKLHAEGKLSEQDLTTFKDAQEAMVNDPLHRGPAVSQALKAAHSALTYAMPGLPGKDPKGEAAYADFVGHFYPTVVQLVRENKLAPGDLNLNDPNSLISKALKPYERTPSQKLADRVSELQSLSGSTGDKVKALMAMPGAMQRTVDGKLQIKVGNAIYDGATGDEIKAKGADESSLRPGAGIKP